jgi:hypothetical protein
MRFFEARNQRIVSFQRQNGNELDRAPETRTSRNLARLCPQIQITRSTTPPVTKIWSSQNTPLVKTHRFNHKNQQERASSGWRHATRFVQASRRERAIHCVLALTHVRDPRCEAEQIGPTLN